MENLYIILAEPINYKELRVPVKINIDDKQCYKFGRSKNLKCRLETMQTDNGAKLVLIKSYPFEDCVVLELLIHNYLNNYRILGEWFILSYEQLIDAQNTVVELMKDITEQKNKNTCIPCNFTIHSSELFEQHLNSTSHNTIMVKENLKLKKINILEIDGVLEESKDVNNDIANLETNIKKNVIKTKIVAIFEKKKSDTENKIKKYCIPCDYTATTLSNLKAHFLSSKHIEKETKYNKEEELKYSKKKDDEILSMKNQLNMVNCLKDKDISEFKYQINDLQHQLTTITLLKNNEIENYKLEIENLKKYKNIHENNVT